MEKVAGKKTDAIGRKPDGLGGGLKMGGTVVRAIRVCHQKPTNQASPEPESMPGATY